MPERILGERDPRKILDAFRELPPEEQMAAAFAESSILRYELRLVEEFIRIFRRLFWPLLVAVVLLIAIGVTSLNNQRVLRDCTEPGNACYQRSQTNTAEIVRQLINDNRLIHGQPTIPPPEVPSE